jgi:hypothetical protein
MGVTISKFAEALLFGVVLFIVIPAIGFYFRSRSPRYASVPRFELFRAIFEFPLIGFVVLVPLAYMWYHTVRFSGIYTCALAVIGFAALYVSANSAQKRNRNRRQNQTPGAEKESS